MTRKRTYRLLCPIARALDAVGDRWTLLILRDLHAGPARFQHLQAGLGVATNLLTSRLDDMIEAGLIERQGQERFAPYALTEAGRRTDSVLFELSKLGKSIERSDDLEEPANVRPIALPLRRLLQSVPSRPRLLAHLVMGDETITIDSRTADVEVYYGASDEAPDLALRTNYQAFLDAGEGLLSLDEFAKNHLEIVDGIDEAGPFLAMMAEALSQ